MFCFAIFHILGWEPNMSQCNVHPYTPTAAAHCRQVLHAVIDVSVYDLLLVTMLVSIAEGFAFFYVLYCIAAGSLSCHYVGVRSQVL